MVGTRRTAGAMLLLGGPMGGELFNPGCVELIRLGELTGVDPTWLVRRVAGPNLLAGGTDASSRSGAGCLLACSNVASR